MQHAGPGQIVREEAGGLHRELPGRFGEGSAAYTAQRSARCLKRPGALQKLIIENRARIAALSQGCARK